MRSTQAAALCVVGLAVFVTAASGLAHRPALSETVTLTVAGRASSTPWVAALDSTVVVAWGARASDKTDVFVSVSTDGGRTFASPRQVNGISGEARLGGELPPRVALRERGDGLGPEIVALWTARGERTEIKVARSHDLGRTFTEETTLQSRGAPGDRGWPALALDSSGEAHAVWLDHRGLAQQRSASDAQSSHKKDGEHDGVAMAQLSGLYYALPSAGPAAERELTKGVCYCCKTALAVARDGSLYAAWRHVYPGNLRDIAFTASRDGGRTFTAPIRVSEDGWSINGCPDDGPAIAVGADNTVHLVWPTVVGGPQPEGAIFYASSRDGRAFSARLRVPTLGGPKPSHPQVVVADSGRIFVAWDESVDGRRVAALREVRIGTDGTQAFGEVVTLSPSGVYPVLAATNKGIVAAWTIPGDPSRIAVSTLDLEQSKGRRRATHARRDGLRNSRRRGDGYS